MEISLDTILTDLPILFTYCRTGSNRHLVTLAEQVSGLLPPMLKSTDGSSPWYKITQYMIGLPCAWVPDPRIWYSIGVTVPGVIPFVSSFLLLWRMLLSYTSFCISKPRCPRVGDGFTCTLVNWEAHRELHSELPSRICTKDQVRKDRGPCLLMEFFIVKSFAHNVIPSHWAVRAPHALWPRRRVPCRPGGRSRQRT